MGIHAEDCYELALLRESELWDRKQELTNFSNEKLMQLIRILEDEATDFLKSVYQFYESRGFISDKQRVAVVNNLSHYPENNFEG